MSYIKYKLLQAYLSTGSAEPVIPEFSDAHKDLYLHFKFSLDSFLRDYDIVCSNVSYNISTAYDIVFDTGKTDLTNYYYSIGSGSQEQKWEKFTGKLNVKLGTLADSNSNQIYFIGNGSKTLNFSILGSASDSFMRSFREAYDNGYSMITHKDGKLNKEDISISGHLDSMYFGANIARYNSYNAALLDHYVNVTFNNLKLEDMGGFDTGYSVPSYLFYNSDTYSYSAPENSQKLIDKLSVGTTTYPTSAYGMFSGLYTDSIYITNRYADGLSNGFETPEQYYESLNNETSTGTSMYCTTGTDFYSQLYEGCKVMSNIDFSVKAYIAGEENIYNLRNNIPYAFKYKSENDLKNASKAKRKRIELNWKSIGKEVHKTGLKTIITNMNSNGVESKSLNICGDLPYLNENNIDYTSYYNQLYTDLNDNSILNNWNIYIHSQLWKGESINIYFVENRQYDDRNGIWGDNVKYHTVTVNKYIKENGETRKIRYKDLLDKISIYTGLNNQYNLLKAERIIPLTGISGLEDSSHMNSSNPTKSPIGLFVRKEEPKVGIKNYDTSASDSPTFTTSYVYRFRKFKRSTGSLVTEKVMPNLDLELTNGMIFFINTLVTNYYNLDPSDPDEKHPNFECGYETDTDGMNNTELHVNDMYKESGYKTYHEGSVQSFTLTK